MPGNKKKTKKQYIMCDLDQCEKVKELEIKLAEAQQWIDSEPDWKDQYMKRYMALQDKIKELKGKLRSVCPHPKTHFEDWPDGGGIEVCDDCGMSRYQWEQGESPWTMVEDIPRAREEVKEGLEQLRKR
ncbi:MAG: hypothetical protein MUP27_08935 [Desulfobacterales bacterium]|nr:hypothetical protein [Desulfobacterales bacterium]